MIPYLAILKDSFREALSSRVLWIVLLVATALLALFAGIGMREQAGAAYNPSDLHDARQWVRRLRAQAAAERPSPGQRIWRHLPEETRNTLGETADSPPQNNFGDPVAAPLAAALNRLNSDRDLYEPAAWRGVRLDEETRELLADGVDNLSNEELARLNRLLVEAAFPAEVAPSRQRELHVSYFGAPFSNPVPLRKDFVLRTTLALFCTFVVGMLGVFAGILVTSSIVPQTFEPGAVDLLLSKPISRRWMYLTKFFGGLSFTFIIAGYLLGGLWLVVGLRHGLWSTQLWACLPVLLFVFAVYYSVSAFAGLVWRNAIVAVVVTIVFWGLCWGLGAVRGIVSSYFLDPVRTVRLLVAGEDWIGANEAGQIFRWDDERDRWDEILVPDEARRWRPLGSFPLAGPVYVPAENRLVVLQRPNRRFAFMSGSIPLSLGQRVDNWRHREGASVPSGTSILDLDDRGKLLALSPEGIHRQSADLSATKSPQLDLFGYKLPLDFRGVQTDFPNVGPPMRLSGPFTAAVDSQTGAIAIFYREELARYERSDNGTYKQTVKQPFPDSEAAILALSGKTLLLGLADGRVLVLDAASLESKREFLPAPGVPPRFIEASPDGRYFAVLLHDRTLHLYDAQNDQLFQPDVPGQKEISAAVFSAPDRLLVADRLTRVSEYRLPGLELERRVEMPMDWLETTYRYLLEPLYTVLPKPSEISNLVTYLISDSRTLSPGMFESDLRARRIQLALWGPLLSNLAFLAVMLTAGCWYVSRKDF